MEFQIPCAYHQGQQITNFCEDPTCLMPLCPKCLPIHSNEHRNRGTFVQLLSIDDAIQRTESLLNQRLQTLKFSSRSNDKFNQIGYELNQTLSQAAREAKEKVINEVNTFFEGLQYKIEKICEELDSNTRQDDWKMHQQKDKIEEITIFKQGLSSRHECLKNLIRAIKYLETGNTLVNSSFEQENTQIRNIQLKIDLSKLTEIQDSLNAYAKPVYISNYMINNSSQLSGYSIPISNIENNNRQYKDWSFVDEDRQSDIRDHRTDNIYTINDLEVARRIQRRDDRKKQIEFIDAKYQRESSSHSPSQIDDHSNVKKSQASTHSITTRDPISSTNFISYEKPSKEQIGSFAKPEEIEFLKQIQDRSFQRERSFQNKSIDERKIEVNSNSLTNISTTSFPSFSQINTSNIDNFKEKIAEQVRAEQSRIELSRQGSFKKQEQTSEQQSYSINRSFQQLPQQQQQQLKQQSWERTSYTQLPPQQQQQYIQPILLPIQPVTPIFVEKIPKTRNESPIQSQVQVIQKVVSQEPVQMNLSYAQQQPSQIVEGNQQTLLFVQQNQQQLAQPSQQNFVSNMANNQFLIQQNNNHNQLPPQRQNYSPLQVRNSLVTGQQELYQASIRSISPTPSDSNIQQSGYLPTLNQRYSYNSLGQQNATPHFIKQI